MSVNEVPVSAIPDFHESKSHTIAAAAIRMALSASRESEKQLMQELAKLDIQCAAADYGGSFSNAVAKIIERAIVTAKREHIISDTHSEVGAVAGAAHEAVSQVINKALGLNVGGKMGIARCGDLIAVCVFFSVGLLHLDEVAIGLGHRVI